MDAARGASSDASPAAHCRRTGENFSAADTATVIHALPAPGNGLETFGKGTIDYKRKRNMAIDMEKIEIGPVALAIP
jgi:hypothetical protein